MIPGPRHLEVFQIPGPGATLSASGISTDLFGAERFFSWLKGSCRVQSLQEFFSVSMGSGGFRWISQCLVERVCSSMFDRMSCVCLYKETSNRKHLSVAVKACKHTYISDGLLHYLPIYLSIHLSIYLSIYLSIATAPVKTQLIFREGCSIS